MEKKELKLEDVKVGDKYYLETGYGYKSISGIFTIERKTKTMIILNNGTRIKPIFNNASRCEQVGSVVWSNNVYILENEKVKNQYNLEIL